MIVTHDVFRRLLDAIGFARATWRDGEAWWHEDIDASTHVLFPGTTFEDGDKFFGVPKHDVDFKLFYGWFRDELDKERSRQEYYASMGDER